jgi:phosphotransferase system enzyme I (PtsI)
MTFALHGVGVSRGIVIGRALTLDLGHTEVVHRVVPQGERGAEQQRFTHAVDHVRAEFDHLKLHVPADAPAELTSLLEVHALLLTDPHIAQEPLKLIGERGMNAEWALSEVVGKLVAQFEAMDDPYLRERKNDILQVAGRLQKSLSGSVTAAHERQEFMEERILVASDLAPADMLEFRHQSSLALAGFVTALGGRTSHTAILARSMNVPAVVGVQGADTRIFDGEWMVVDADAATVLIAPDEPVLAFYRQRMAQQVGERAALGALNRQPATTRDGHTVRLMANIELPEDTGLAMKMNADGVGLFRSEFLFLGRNELPGEEEQFEAYRAAIQGMQGRPVTIRTLDVGADKALAGDHAPPPAENPALGLRAIRYSLADPPMFRTQLRALLRASAFGPLRILVPMLASAREIDATLAQIQIAQQELRDLGVAYDERVPVGGMIEIPAAAIAIGAFTRKLDFLSVGTNDLIQYTLAIDRTDASVAELYEPLHPAVLALIAQTIHAGARAGLEVSVCGEMAGDPEFAPLLLGLGLPIFSATSAQLPYLREAIRGLRYDEARLLAQAALEEIDSRVIRECLRQFMQQKSAPARQAA